MAKKITNRTRLKVGDIIAWKIGNDLAVYQIAKLESNAFGDVICALNKSPDHKEFKKENGVDVYCRIYKSDLIKQYEAEVISVAELISHYEHSKCVIRDLESRHQKLKTEHENWLRLKKDIMGEAKNGKPNFPCRVKR